jgi:hypothetical protein
MALTPDTQVTRTTEELKSIKFEDLNSAEIRKFEREDPAAYQASEAAYNASFSPPPPPEGEPLPMSKARQIYRNGELVNTELAVRFVNGVIQQ